MDWLRRWYGILPSDLTNYQNRQHHEGWLIAWEHAIVSPIGVTLPPTQQLGRNGFRRIAPTEARKLGLPQPGRPPLSMPEPLVAELDVFAPPRDRTIPQATKNAVWRRDGERCQLCSETNGPWHIDHIFPYSKGGSNSLENLRILCATCNLRKGALIEGDAPTVPVVQELVDAAELTGIAVPTTLSELGNLVVAMASRGHPTEALQLAWSLDAHPDASHELCEVLVAGLKDVAGNEARLFTMLQNEEVPIDELKDLARRAEPAIAGRAAAELGHANLDNDAERMTYARQAREQAVDAQSQALAALTIGGLTDNDAEWHAELTFAYEHGDAWTRSTAALRFGVDLESDDEAYKFLEAATRAASREIAATAAYTMAERFAYEPAIAERYMAMQKQLESNGW